MRELSLFDLAQRPLPSRNSNPETSKQAARQAARPAASHRELILRALSGWGPAGGTHDELDALHDWHGGTANRRLCELLRAGLVVRLNLRRTTRRGADASVYVLPEHAP